jgi:hypothetical protein
MFKDLIAIWREKCQVHKALRMMSKQTWSVEFLTKLLQAAANAYKQNLEMDIVSPDGAKITVRTITGQQKSDADFNIFDHLDDDIRVKNFITQMSGGK